MSTDWSAVDDLLARAMADQVVPGAVAVIGSVDAVLYRAAVGFRDVEAAVPMTVDTMFRVASQAKLPTAILALRLVERGRLSLDAPVGDVLPAFDALPVLDGFDGDRPRLRKPAARATIRQLLTHTSGLGYDIWNNELARYYRLTGQPALSTGSRTAFTAPLIADPGRRFSYSMSMDWLGAVVEAVQDRPLPDLLAAEITGPLGMADTVMWMTGERRARAAAVHIPDPERGWRPTRADYYDSVDQTPEFHPGGHSLYATAEDYLLLQQVLLRDGAYPGGRLLERATVDSMFADALGGLDDGIIETADPAASEPVDLRGLKWSLGLLVNPAGVRSPWPKGSAGWAGGFNSFYFVDRERGLCAGLYTQTLPFWEDRIVALATDFQQAVLAAA